MKGAEIVVGISGGVAAYKAATLVSQLVQAGAGVSVVLTAAAEQFMGAAALAALSGRPVARGQFNDASHPQDLQHPLGNHIALSEQRDLLVVAPATANFLAKAAQGLADDLLSTLYLAFTGPVLVAPAMNSAMWAKPAVQRNVAQLRADGVQFVDPESGWLSCRQMGAGRMAAPEKIFAAMEQLLAKTKR